MLIGGGMVGYLDARYPPPLDRIRDVSVRVVDRHGHWVRGFTTQEGRWRFPTDPTQVDPLYLAGLIAYEDQRFYQHWGVDPLALLRAIYQWVRTGRVVSGASTLTMQTARLLEPRPRTVTAKVIEMVRALQLEARFSKSDILAMYLTLAPFGGNLEGIQAASRRYFGKDPRHLTVAQAALLIALPQAPSRVRPDRRPHRAQQARDKVLRRLVERHVITAQQAQEASQEPIGSQPYAFPFHAPHLAQWLVQHQPDQTVHRTLLDGSWQRLIEGWVRQQPLAPDTQVGLLLVDNATAEVRVYVGSADFFDAKKAGQVDMVRAIRSPGSTLKPFIYGIGFDDRLIHPETLMDDVPMRFGDYQPSNFHDTYQGQLTVREALQRSLNVPAVALLEKIGPHRLVSRFQQVGVSLQWPKPLGHTVPGLPIALGGVGVSLWDLVKLYSGLARDGHIMELRLTADQAIHNSILMSPTAAWYLTEILEDTAPPDEVVVSQYQRYPRPIAYKTGTSYGFRDAWAIGFTKEMTIGVWVGRPDGSPRPGHYGRNTAAPLLFQLFHLIPKPTWIRPAPPPPDALLLRHSELPERLRHFRRASPIGHDTHRPAVPLVLQFPVHGSMVELQRDDITDQLMPLPLVARGGRKPLHWFVNSYPLDTHQHETRWQPNGPGWVQVTVMDSTGQVAHAEVRLVRRAAD